MTMRNQIKNALPQFFIWQVPSILEGTAKDDCSTSEGEEGEDEDKEEKSEGEEMQEGGTLSEEAQLDRKVPTGNRKCRTDELCSVVKNNLVFLSLLGKEEIGERSTEGEKEN